MRIVKCRAGYRKQFERIPGFVYCGRAYGGFDASPLANPYRIGKGIDLTTSLKMYRWWLWEILKRDRDNYCTPQGNILDRLTEDSVLGCWCVDKPVAGEGPDACHCDIIARAAAWLKGQRATVS